MDQSIVTRTQELFGESFKTYESPMKTQFIEGLYNEKAYLISYNPRSNYYVLTIDDKPILIGIQKESILERL